jgi:hypothetical protein
LYCALNARVPSDFKNEDEFAFGSWVSSRRRDYKNSRLDPDRVHQLEAIEGWVWDPIAADFEFGLEQLKKYVTQNGNARVPTIFQDDDKFALGKWVSIRRTGYKKGSLDPDKVRQLEAIKGWVWKVQ